MSSASSSSSSTASATLLSQLEEHAVALASLPDAHAAIAIALHLHTLKSRTAGTKCISLSDAEVAGDKGLPSIPPGWSSNADGFCFQYLIPAAPSSAASSASSARPLNLLVKSIRLDRSLLVHACIKSADGTSAKDIQSIEINVDDFVNAKSMPNSSAAASSAGAASSSASQSIDFSTLFKDLPSLLALYDRMLDQVLPKPPSADAGKSQQQQQPPHPDYMDPYANDPLRDNRQPRQPFAPQPEGFDPLRVYPSRGGAFGGDIDPLSGGPSGNLMGPGNFPFGGVHGSGGAHPGAPGMAPRFDPYGPVPGMGRPDFDELPPPGAGGPLGMGGGSGLGGPLGGPRRGGGGGGGGFGGMSGGTGPFGGGRGFM